MGENSAITGNTAQYGGGVQIIDRSIFTMIGNARIAANRGEQSGGGIYITAAEMTIGGEAAIDENSSANGGGVFMASGGGVFTMKENSRIRGNRAHWGSAVYLNGAESVLRLEGGSITENQADNAGTLMLRGGRGEMTGGLITGNRAQNQGGGIYTSNGGVFTQEGGDIRDNSPDDRLDR
jgi:predicted outer membrane repeat protein